jgi:galactoside O-acetyltransferase
MNYVGVSSRVSIYSSTDDYSGEYLSNPTIPDKYKNVYNAPVIIEENVLIGCGSVILPGVTIGLGSSIGALSLVVRSIEKHELHAGVPTKFIKPLSKDLLNKKILYEEEKKS